MNIGRAKASLWELQKIRVHSEYYYPHFLGITRRSCLEAPQVLDMEYQEQDWPEHRPRGPTFSSFIILVLSAAAASITIGLILYQKSFLLHEVIGPGIMVCVTFEHWNL